MGRSERTCLDVWSKKKRRWLRVQLQAIDTAIRSRATPAAQRAVTTLLAITVVFVSAGSRDGVVCVGEGGYNKEGVGLVGELLVLRLVPRRITCAYL
jgi:hypothetical protein